MRKMGVKEKVEISEMLKVYAENRYKEEVRRENSLVEQASKLQSSFSFVSVSVLTVADIAVSNKGCLSYSFFMLTFSTIMIAIAVSLVFATIAQARATREDFATTSEVKDFLIDQVNAKSLKTDVDRNFYWINTYEKIERGLTTSNNKKLRFIKISTLFFYISIGLSAYWFVIATIIM